ncbi:MAG: TlpA disulfide reductase family protein [Bacteroidia bacterium]|nr:TlpA disulfide reductase family protein [Bacteroidia bacterium]
MKKLLPLALLITLMFGCKTEKNPVCTITGKASNYDAKELYMTLDGPKDTIRLNADGTFSKEIAVSRPIDGTLQGDKLFLYLYLEPGKNLTIDFDAKAFDTSVGFGGDLGLPVEYLHDKTLGSSALYQKLNEMYKSPNTPTDFKRVRDSLSQVEIAFLVKFKNDNPGLADAFFNREMKVLEYSVYYDLYNYPTMAGYYDTTHQEIPSGWFAFMDKLNLDDPALVEISDIKAFISGYVQQEAMKRANIPQLKSWGNPALEKAMVAFVNEKFKSPEIYSVIVYDKLKQYIDSEGTTGIEDLVTEYLAKSTNEKYKASIKEMSDKWAVLAPGQPAPAFTLLDINGDNVSLTDFKGKYVFIDFWATWCGPCRAEIPAYKQLVAGYKGRNIVFISMSVDKDKAAWEKMVRADNFEWVQLHDPQTIKANKKYLVMYIPTFTLIDPDGKIVNARCPRPSNPELRAIFDKLDGI